MDDQTSPAPENTPAIPSASPASEPVAIGFDMVNPTIPGPLKEKLGTGGFGIVYKDPRNPDQRCVKQYKNVAIGEEADRLMRFAAVDQWARPSDAELMKSSFAWPLEVFGEVGRIQAFTMDTAPEDAHFELRMKNGNKYRRLLQLDYLIDATYFNSNAIDSTSAVVFTLQDRIELAINICDSIMALHRYGLVYQDVSSKNIVARRANPRTCFILDADSITTPEGAIAKPIGSPTWEVPTGLDPFAVDRARLALMVLRLIVQGHSVRPDVGCPDLVRRGYNGLSIAIQQTFDTGEEAAADAIVRELRLLRDEQHATAAFAHAIQSRIARRVVREGISVRAVNDINLVTAARLHVDREAALEAAELREQRKMLQSIRSQNTFAIDVLASVGIMPLPRTPDELHELAFNSYFADVAQHLVRTGIPGLMGDPIMESIADRAIVEADSGDISSRTQPGRGTLRIEWPETDFVTAAEICLLVGGVQQSIEIVKRAPSDIFMEREIRAQSGGSVTARVRFGITTLQGDVILQHSTSLQTDVIVPAIPVPVASTSKHSGSVPMIDLVDPIEEARLAEIARLAHRKKIRNRILMGIAAIPLLILGGYLYNRFTDDTEKVVLETGYLKNQIDAAKAAGDLLRGTETGYLKNQIDAAKAAADAQTPATTIPATTTLPAAVTTTVAPTKTSAP
jgi:hypothetical protein